MAWLMILEIGQEYIPDGSPRIRMRCSQPIVCKQVAYRIRSTKAGDKHGDWACPMSAVCNAGKTYGLTVRVKQELDLRRFPSIPRATKQFERLDKGRTNVERVIAWLKIFWGADDGNVNRCRAFPCPGGNGHDCTRGIRHGVIRRGSLQTGHLFRAIPRFGQFSDRV